ncbi:MAG: exosortase-associated EpsI family protein [Euryarchaeota archaeon]|nr:exosortase-associated EpsI family protein [Euryarchaeota archaeon]
MLGVISLAAVLTFLLAPAGIADYTVVGTSYWHETRDRLLLKTAYEYNNIEEIKNFPAELGDWRGYDFRYPKEVYETLNASIMLSRSYSRDGDLLWMDIINSNKGESFHDPKICYGGSWDIVNESVETFHVTGNQTHLTFSEMRTNRLDIARKDNPDTRQVVLYWFMFKRFSDEGVTMIRLSAPVKDDYEATFAMVKGFLEDELFAEMYEGEVKEITVAERMIETRGALGVLLIVILILLPVCLIFSGLLKRWFGKA